MIEEVRILQSQFNTDRVYVKIALKNGNYMNTFLDFSVNAKAGDYLEIDSLRVKSETYKTGEKIQILKGKIIPQHAII